MFKQRQDNFFDVCRKCKINCCRNVKPPITRKRMETIEKYLKQQGIHIENPFVKENYIFPREDDEGFCIFFDRKSKICRVHPVKPETCVAGPITFDINSATGKIEWYLKMEKICPLAGELYRNREKLKKHLESAKKEILQLIQELDSKALQTILKIEESETFKIGEDEVDNDIPNKIRNI